LTKVSKSFVACFMLFTLTSTFSPLFGDNINPPLFSTTENPYNSSIANWTQKWWNWYVSFNQSRSPSSIDDENYCKSRQIDKNVWFLTGAQGGVHTRVCTIPAGTAIFIAHGYECSEFENEGIPVDKLYDDCALDQIKKGFVDFLNVELDGVPLKNTSHYGIGARVFDLYYPEDDVFMASRSGDAKAAHYTYSFLFKPLSLGEHTLRMNTASSPSYPSPDNPTPFAWDVTYKIKVQ
jgi:hypothetical protein